MINKILQDNSITKYRLSKLSGIPYTTINDICSGKADIKKCSADTIYKIAKTLCVSMETLLEPYYEDRPDFELFKSGTCHRLKQMGDVDFIIDTLERDIIAEYYDRKWYPEAFYLLAMLDYISRENDVPICSKYEELRRQKLSKTIYPRSILSFCAATKNEKAKEDARTNAIPEFMRHNIVENEVRDVI